MRLVCPNCGAQYEVPDSVIPESGRDVQCSSCGNTWFQRHPSQAGADDAGADLDSDDLARDDLPRDDLDSDDPDTTAPAWDDGESDASDQRHITRSDRQTPAAAAASRQAQHVAAKPDQAADELQDDDDWQDNDDIHAPQSDSADAGSADDEWQGFPSDPGLTDTPQASTRLVKDPEDPMARLPDIDEDDYEEDPARDLPAPRRSLDTSIADMLREEAEREARARAAERNAGLESQPDLGLDSGPSVRPAAGTATDTGTTQADRDAMRRMEEAQMRKARLKGDDPALPRVSAATPAPNRSTPAHATPERSTPDLTQQQTAAPDPAAPPRGPISDDAQIAAVAAAVAESRRGLLPDIEEINSSLRSTSDRRPARADDHDTPGQTNGADPRQAAPARSFNRGFSVTLLIAMVLLALYVFAPALAKALPAMAPPLDSYVAAVDDLRIMLDAQVQTLSRWLADIAGSTG
ncbi:MAG: zinc-ribbon domain-containing protein [Rhodobacterales bacterium]